MKIRNERNRLSIADQKKLVAVLVPSWLAPLFREIVGRERAGEAVADILAGLVVQDAGQPKDRDAAADAVMCSDRGADPSELAGPSTTPSLVPVDRTADVEMAAALAGARAELSDMESRFARGERQRANLEADFAALRERQSTAKFRILAIAAFGCVAALAGGIWIGAWIGAKDLAGDLAAAKRELVGAKIELERAQDLTLELLSRPQP